MRRRDFIGTAAAALLLPGAAVAQQPGRIYRIGFLGIVPRDDPDSAPIYEALFDTLRGQGLIEGENLIVTLRVSRGREDRFGEYAAELASHKVDVIVAVGSAATLAAKRVSSTIPIVMGAVPNPESLGIVTSLARPGGNVTGVSTMLLDIAGKVREISKEAMPNR
ncbi:MAG: ABC transporter substrate-binding protein, partial [Deltaproteobacteria bacterium]|nr:ABC transporter substrate-binding protein [Deltaproteobacteria bacterium]